MLQVQIVRSTPVQVAAGMKVQVKLYLQCMTLDGLSSYGEVEPLEETIHPNKSLDALIGRRSDVKLVKDLPELKVGSREQIHANS